MSLGDCTAQYGGYTQAEATEYAEEDGFRVRITSRDGVGYMGTSDVDPCRLNLDIAKDRVERAFVG